MSCSLECCSTCVYCKYPWEFLLHWYSCVLYRMFYGNFLKSSYGSLLSLSGIFLVVLFMGHPSHRKLTFLGLPALEIGDDFLSHLCVTCGKHCAFTEYKCTQIQCKLFENGGSAKQHLYHWKAGIKIKWESGVKSSLLRVFLFSENITWAGLRVSDLG